MLSGHKARLCQLSKEHGRTVVVWEEGPHGWMSVFPCGGMLSGTSWEVPEAELPKDVWVEPNDGCVVRVYQEAWVPRFELLVTFERTPLANCWTSEWPLNARVN